MNVTILRFIYDIWKITFKWLILLWNQPVEDEEDHDPNLKTNIINYLNELNHLGDDYKELVDKFIFQL